MDTTVPQATGHDLEFHELEVTEIVEETADTRSFVLRIPPEIKGKFRYVAGQFCTFRADVDGESVARSYSMSSSPDRGEPFKTTVKRVPGGRLSNWLNDHLAAGDRIEAMAPSGLFVLRDATVPIVAFAGGSGITPVISIVKSALRTTEREIVLVYANRDADSVIFAEELDRLEAEAGGRLVVHRHLDAQSGFLDADTCAAFVGDRKDADFYVCGPAPYMDTVEAGLAKVGFSPDQLFIERFVAPGDAPSGEIESATESLVIQIDRRRHELDYRSGDTVLDSARRAGLSPPFSCESGSCGTCMAKVEKGEARMRANNALTADEVEEGWVLTCQAIPTSETARVNYDA